MGYKFERMTGFSKKSGIKNVTFDGTYLMEESNLADLSLHVQY
jgi:hypothetical protein